MAEHTPWHDAHSSIAKLALPILKDFYIFKSGFPAALIDQTGDHERASVEWDRVLLNIINAMQHLTDPEWEETDKSRVKDQEAFINFGKYFTHLWD